MIVKTITFDEAAGYKSYPVHGFVSVVEARRNELAYICDESDDVLCYLYIVVVKRGDQFPAHNPALHLSTYDVRGYRVDAFLTHYDRWPPKGK